MSLDNLTIKERHEYLRANKANLIAAKSAEVKFTDSISVTPVVAVREVKEKAAKEDSSSEDSSSIPDSVEVTVVCNTAWFCDSQMDVLTSTAYDSSVATKGSNIPHIADHRQSSTAHVGDVLAVYTQELPLTSLGLNQEGTTTALLMDSRVRKDYNEDVYKFYKNGKINQHSIGLRYTDIKLAMNSGVEDDKKEKAVWDEYFPKIINKDLVEAKGYFWAVKDVNVMENSCVLFGANSLTPTLSIKSNSGEVLPPDVNVKQPKEEMKMSDATAEKLVALQSEVDALKESRTLDIAKAVQAERTRCEKILSSASTFNIKNETAAKAITKGWSLDMVADMFTELAEKADNETAVKTGAAPLASADTIKLAELQKLASASNEPEKVIAGGQLSVDDVVKAMAEMGGV